jgi:hypothetical protein
MPRIVESRKRYSGNDFSYHLEEQEFPTELRRAVNRAGLPLPMHGHVFSIPREKLGEVQRYYDESVELRHKSYRLVEELKYAREEYDRRHSLEEIPSQERRIPEMNGGPASHWDPYWAPVEDPSSLRFAIKDALGDTVHMGRVRSGESRTSLSYPERTIIETADGGQAVPRRFLPSIEKNYRQQLYWRRRAEDFLRNEGLWRAYDESKRPKPPPPPPPPRPQAPPPPRKVTAGVQTGPIDRRLPLPPRYRDAVRSLEEELDESTRHYREHEENEGRLRAELERVQGLHQESMRTAQRVEAQLREAVEEREREIGQLQEQARNRIGDVEAVRRQVERLQQENAAFNERLERSHREGREQRERIAGLEERLAGEGGRTGQAVAEAQEQLRQELGERYGRERAEGEARLRQELGAQQEEAIRAVREPLQRELKIRRAERNLLRIIGIGEDERREEAVAGATAPLNERIAGLEERIAGEEGRTGQAVAAAQEELRQELGALHGIQQAEAVAEATGPLQATVESLRAKVERKRQRSQAQKGQLREQGNELQETRAQLGNREEELANSRAETAAVARGREEHVAEQQVLVRALRQVTGTQGIRERRWREIEALVAQGSPEGVNRELREAIQRAMTQRQELRRGQQTLRGEGQRQGEAVAAAQEQLRQELGERYGRERAEGEENLRQEHEREMAGLREEHAMREGESGQRIQQLEEVRARLEDELREAKAGLEVRRGIERRQEEIAQAHAQRNASVSRTIGNRGRSEDELFVLQDIPYTAYTFGGNVESSVLRRYGAEPDRSSIYVRNRREANQEQREGEVEREEEAVQIENPLPAGVRQPRWTQRRPPRREAEVAPVGAAESHDAEHALAGQHPVEDAPEGYVAPPTGEERVEEYLMRIGEESEIESVRPRRSPGGVTTPYRQDVSAFAEGQEKVRRIVGAIKEYRNWGNRVQEYVKQKRLKVQGEERSRLGEALRDVEFAEEYEANPERGNRRENRERMRGISRRYGRGGRPDAGAIRERLGELNQGIRREQNRIRENPEEGISALESLEGVEYENQPVSAEERNRPEANAFEWESVSPSTYRRRQGPESDLAAWEGIRQNYEGALEELRGMNIPLESYRVGEIEMGRPLRLNAEQRYFLKSLPEEHQPDWVSEYEDYQAVGNEAESERLLERYPVLTGEALAGRGNRRVEPMGLMPRPVRYEAPSERRDALAREHRRRMRRNYQRVG